MNIFALDANPILAAQYHHDKHVVKMTLESAQILSTVQYLITGNVVGYKPTHINHPAVLWAARYHCNYNWLYALFKSLAEEYTYRFNKVHKSWNDLQYTLNLSPLFIQHDEDDHEPFVQCMPEQYKNRFSPVLAYRKYYFYEKYTVGSSKYTNRPIPPWLPQITI